MLPSASSDNIIQIPGMSVARDPCPAGCMAEVGLW
jgi:hypothetical protein